MNRKREQRGNPEPVQRDLQVQGWANEREDIQATLKKVKKSQLAYIKNTDWMFSNQHFEEPIEHMSPYFF
jgi:hypothetical protein